MTASELPTKVPISSPMLEVLEFTDNSAARATALVVQSKGLRSLEADASTVEFRADSASLECISLSNVQSVELPLICNPENSQFAILYKSSAFSMPGFIFGGAIRHIYGRHPATSRKFSASPIHRGIQKSDLGGQAKGHSMYWS